MDDDTQKVNPGFIIAGIFGGILLVVVITGLVMSLRPKPNIQVVRSIRRANETLRPTAAISPRLLSGGFLREKTFFDEISEQDAALRRDAMNERRLRDQELAEESSRPRYATQL